MMKPNNRDYLPLNPLIRRDSMKFKGDLIIESKMKTPSTVQSTDLCL